MKIPHVKLTRKELADETFPQICMVCGEPPAVHVDRKFTWAPQWVGVVAIMALLPGVICYFVVKESIRFRVPLCEVHRTHWSRRWKRIGIIFGVVVLMWVGIFAWFNFTGGPGSTGEISGDAGLAGFFATMFAFLICLFVLADTIRVSKMTKKTVTFNKVGKEFVEAVEAQRDAEYDEPRPRAKARRVEERHDEYAE